MGNSTRRSPKVAQPPISLLRSSFQLHSTNLHDDECEAAFLKEFKVLMRVKSWTYSCAVPYKSIEMSLDPVVVSVQLKRSAQLFLYVTDLLQRLDLKGDGM
jgi:hypothetical protein